MGSGASSSEMFCILEGPDNNVFEDNGGSPVD